RRRLFGERNDKNYQHSGTIDYQHSRISEYQHSRTIELDADAGRIPLHRLASEAQVQKRPVPTLSVRRGTTEPFDLAAIRSWRAAGTRLRAQVTCIVSHVAASAGLWT